MNQNDKDIAKKQRENLEIFMKKQGLNAYSWSKKAGISEATIRNYLGGITQSLTSVVLKKMANSVGCRVSDLIEESEDEHQSCLDRKKFIHSFSQYNQLVNKINIEISSEEEIKVLLAWYDLKNI